MAWISLAFQGQACYNVIIWLTKQAGHKAGIFAWYSFAWCLLNRRPCFYRSMFCCYSNVSALICSNQVVLLNFCHELVQKCANQTFTNIFHIEYLVKGSLHEAMVSLKPSQIGSDKYVWRSALKHSNDTAFRNSGMTFQWSLMLCRNCIRGHLATDLKTVLSLVCISNQSSAILCAFPISAYVLCAQDVLSCFHFILKCNKTGTATSRSSIFFVKQTNFVESFE